MQATTSMAISTILPDGATDELVISMWLHGRPPSTQDAYRRDIEQAGQFTGKGLRETTLFDLQEYADSLLDLAPRSQSRKLSAVKSLFTFAHKAGYLTLNVGVALRLPKVEEKLAERLMSEEQIQRMLALETDTYHHALLRLMYNTAARVSEIVALRWSDVADNSQGGQVRLFGKGGKERYLPISHETYQELLALRELRALKEVVSLHDPVFFSRWKRGKGLSRQWVFLLVEQAAVRAGIALYENGDGVTHSHVSPHWIRHAHASHALERGAPVMLVRDTLGHASIYTTNKYSHAKPGESSGKYLAI